MFVIVGDFDMKMSFSFVWVLFKVGVDIIEFGMLFIDLMVDGFVI